MNYYTRRRSTVRTRVYDRRERFPNTKRSVNGTFKKVLRLRRALENMKLDSTSRDKIQERLQRLTTKIQDYDIEKAKSV